MLLLARHGGARVALRSGAARMLLSVPCRRTRFGYCACHRLARVPGVLDACGAVAALTIVCMSRGSEPRLRRRLTPRWSGRVRDKVPSSYSACAPLNSTVRAHKVSFSSAVAPRIRTRSIDSRTADRHHPLRAAALNCRGGAGRPQVIVGAHEPPEIDRRSGSAAAQLLRRVKVSHGCAAASYWRHSASSFGRAPFDPVSSEKAIRQLAISGKGLKRLRLGSTCAPNTSLERTRER